MYCFLVWLHNAVTTYTYKLPDRMRCLAAITNTCCIIILYKKIKGR